MRPRRRIATRCGRCGVEGWRHDYAWMSHEDFCWPCMEDLVKQGFAVRESDGPVHTLTSAGAVALPQHAVVADCPTCGMPVYRRWIDEGVASADPLSCPYCLDVGDLVRRSGGA